VSLPSRARLATSRDLSTYVKQSLAIGVLHVGDNEPLLGRDGDSHVDVMLVDDGVAIHLRVDGRELLERLTHRAHEERHERQLDAMLLLDLLLVLVAQRIERGHVDFVERRQVRGGVLGLEQILGDALAARRHLLARLALTRCRAISSRDDALGAGAWGAQQLGRPTHRAWKRRHLALFQRRRRCLSRAPRRCGAQRETT